MDHNPCFGRGTGSQDVTKERWGLFAPFGTPESVSARMIATKAFLEFTL